MSVRIPPNNQLILPLHKDHRPCPNKEDLSDPKSSYRQISNDVSDFYQGGFSSVISPPSILATLGAMVSGFQMYREFSPATLTYFGISLDEFLNVPISHRHALKWFYGDTGAADVENPTDAQKVEAKRAVDRKEASIAALQFFAGTSGLSAFAYEKLFKKDDSNHMNLFDKIALTIGSGITSFGMFHTFLEKSLMATLSAGKTGEGISEGIMLNARSDLRAAIESGVMVAYAWLNAGLMKTAVDIAVPLFAIRDGIGHFLDNGFNPIFFDRDSTKFSDKVKNWGNRLLVRSGHSSDNSQVFPLGVLSRDWYLGDGGWRDRFVMPIYRMLRLDKAPRVHLRHSKDDEGNILEQRELFVDITRLEANTKAEPARDVKVQGGNTSTVTTSA